MEPAELAEKRFSKSVSKAEDVLYGATTVFLGRLRANVDDGANQVVFGRGSFET